MNFHMFEQCTDVSCNNIFAWLNQGPLTLTIFLHTIIVIPMFFIYKQEKARLEREQ